MLNIASTRPASLCKVVKLLARIGPHLRSAPEETQACTRHLDESSRAPLQEQPRSTCVASVCKAKHPYAKCIGDSIRLDAANGLKYAWKMSQFFTAQSSASEGTNSPVVVPVTVTVANLP